MPSLQHTRTLFRPPPRVIGLFGLLLRLDDATPDQGLRLPPPPLSRPSCSSNESSRFITRLCQPSDLRDITKHQLWLLMTCRLFRSPIKSRSKETSWRCQVIQPRVHQGRLFVEGLCNVWMCLCLLTCFEPRLHSYCDNKRCVLEEESFEQYDAVTDWLLIWRIIKTLPPSLLPFT